MTKKKNVIYLEFNLNQKSKPKPKPKQKKVTIEVKLDEDIATELAGSGYYTFEKLKNDDKIRHLTPLLWKQLDRVMARWQHSSRRTLNPNKK